MTALKTKNDNSKITLDVVLISVFLMSSGCGILSKQSTDDLVFSVKNVSFAMKYVPGGTFEMGATSEQGSDAANDEKPVHSVTLSSYCIGETEVTQGLWKAVMGSNPSDFKKGDDYPVENITWYDAVMFCNKLSEATNRDKVYTIIEIQYSEKEQKKTIVNATITADFSKNGFRLPSEAQWEYAARGGKSGGTKYSGSDNLAKVAWYGYYDENDDNRTITSETPMPVAQKKSNSLGIYDISGNVWEWCQDWYKNDYSKESPSNNPQWPSSGSSRVLRGGSWLNSAKSCRVSYRHDVSPDRSDDFIGMRLALPCSPSPN